MMQLCPFFPRILITAEQMPLHSNCKRKATSSGFDCKIFFTIRFTICVCPSFGRHERESPEIRKIQFLFLFYKKKKPNLTVYSVTNIYRESIIGVIYTLIRLVSTGQMRWEQPAKWKSSWQLWMKNRPLKKLLDQLWTFSSPHRPKFWWPSTNLLQGSKEIQNFFKEFVDCPTNVTDIEQRWTLINKCYSVSLNTPPFGSVTELMAKKSHSARSGSLHLTGHCTADNQVVVNYCNRSTQYEP